MSFLSVAGNAAINLPALSNQPFFRYFNFAILYMAPGSLFFVLILRMKKHLDRLDGMEADEIVQDNKNSPIPAIVVAETRTNY